MDNRQAICDTLNRIEAENLRARVSELEAQNQELSELLRVAIGNWCDGCDWEACDVFCPYYRGKKLLEGG